MNIYNITKSLEDIGLKDGDKVLIALSGGVDSLSLAYSLFKSPLNLECYAAHMNFSLRDEESDCDEQFVKEWCATNNIKLFTKRVDTYSFSKEKGISIEMGARELRYNWFYELLDSNNIKYLAVGHNADDNAETLMLNLLRGTGVKGLCGIQYKINNIIRPLLPYTRKEIEKFADYYNLSYRIDSTNNSNDYSRNKIRNIVFPALKTINPSLIKTLNRNIKYFNSANNILVNLFNTIKSSFYSDLDNDFMKLKINVSKLQEHENWDYWLYMSISEFGFNSVHSEDITQCLLQEYNGVKKFKNDSFILIIERGYIKIYDISILSKIEVISIDKININEQLNLEYGDYEIIVSHINNSSDIYDSLLVNTSNVIYLDSNKIVFPVKLRALENGDKFTPFGMKGAKKVNDFLTDIKIDNLFKARVPIITNPANQIISVAGFRIDNKYRVCKETQSIYKIEFLSTN